MGFRKVAFYSFLVLVVLYTAINFPEIPAAVFRLINNLVPKLIQFLSHIATKTRDYCLQDLGKDVKRLSEILSQMSKAISQFLSPLGKRFCQNIVDVLEAVHKNAMSYTEDGLNQILGVEDSLLPQHVTASRHKLISLILLALWIVMGVISLTRLSYNKFFLLMSGSFLVHSIFGPVWCVRRLAFLIGLCMWIGSLVANKPIPAAITILILFLLTGLRKWRKRLAKARSAEDLMNFNRTMDQRMDSLEKKVDVILAKVEFLVDRIPDRANYKHA